MIKKSKGSDWIFQATALKQFLENEFLEIIGGNRMPTKSEAKDLLGMFVVLVVAFSIYMII